MTSGYHCVMRNQPTWRALTLYAVFGFSAFIVPVVAHAADLGFSPSTGKFPLDTEFTVKVTILPSGDSVNASDGKISFDAEKLSVTNISKDGSAFSLWTADPSYSNSAGTISYSGGSPSAFKNDGTILTIKFKPKALGTAALSFSSGTVLAADGKGTDVYKKGGTASLEIIAAAPVADIPPPDSGGASGDGVTPIAPVITSSTHAKSESWYATTTALFSWKPTADVTDIRTLFSDKDTVLPASLQDQKLSTSQKTVATKDGIWYFYAQYKNDFGWGEMAKKVIQIDTVPPKEFGITLKADGPDATAPKFAFSAEDELSGVDRYEILFGSTSVATIKSGDMSNGATPVPPQPGGITHVIVKAYDKASNIRISEKDLTLPAVAKPIPKGSEPPVVEKVTIWTIERILLIILALIVGGVLTSNYYARKKTVDDKAKLLQAVLEVREKNDRIFAAMREEFEQMVNDFDERPQLSAAERDFLEKIKEVLDISEELVDTGIEDLKKKVRGQ